MKAAVLAPEPTQIASNSADLKHCRASAPGELTSPNFSCRCRFLENANVIRDYPKSAQGQQNLVPLARTSILAFLMAKEYTQDSTAVTECQQFRLSTMLQLISPSTPTFYYIATQGLQS